MKSADAAQRVMELREQIHRHDHLYYVESRPEVSDAEYDALMRELRALEAEFPELVTPESPTQRVAGTPLDAFQSVEHRVAMLSLDNATTPEDLREFEARITRVLPGQRFTYVSRPIASKQHNALVSQGQCAARSPTVIRCSSRRWPW